MRRRLIVQGDVQGVNFRAETRRRAEAEGVAGWVRNRDDGTVEAVFEGDEAAVGRMVDFCREGPRAAGVEDLDLLDEEEEGLSGFEVR